MTTIKFEVGQTYSERFASDYDTIASFTIMNRTAKTITTLVHGKTVNRRITTYGGVETFKPFGTYSMAMMVYANKAEG